MPCGGGGRILRRGKEEDELNVRPPGEAIGGGDNANDTLRLTGVIPKVFLRFSDQITPFSKAQSRLALADRDRDEAGRAA